jgi:hypothetical protein
MIRYSLVCAKAHGFESWFQNSAAYDKQTKRGLVTCPVCGSAKVEKAIMAPRLARTDRSKTRAEPAPMPAPPATPTTPAPPAEPSNAVAMMSPREREFRQKLRELRQHITKNADNVGRKFPEEARKMHYGEAEHRSIYGEASPDEAKELHEEGIEFHPLPVLPDERNYPQTDYLAHPVTLRWPANGSGFAGPMTGSAALEGRRPRGRHPSRLAFARTSG